MHLEKEITEMAIACGWDYCGFADLTRFHNYINSFCGPFINKFPRAISLVISLSNAVVDAIIKQERDKILSFHNYNYYAIDYLQDTGTVRIANFLERNGWSAYPIPASYAVYQDPLAALISHKLVARAAGLGWIGKNGLFLTPREGPRVRLASILTDAPLETAQQPMESACHNCLICQLACPAGAIKGREFSEREADCEQVDSIKCFDFMENRKKQWGIEIERCVCGLCVAICPFGRKSKS